MSDLYTVGIWTVKSGREDEFVAEWRAMGEATVAEFPIAHGVLLRDLGDPRRFVSFGPWQSREMVEAWRTSKAFQEGIARLGDVLEAFEPGTYEVKAEVAAAS